MTFDEDTHVEEEYPVYVIYTLALQVKSSNTYGTSEDG
jgi:hypothetical protein